MKKRDPSDRQKKPERKRRSKINMRLLLNEISSI